VAGSSVVGITVLRTLLLIHVQNWNAVTNLLRVGLIVDDKGNVGPGPTQLSAASRNVDWYFYTDLYPVSSGAAVSVATTWPWTGQAMDIRSRRVIKDMGRTAILALQNQNIVGALQVDIHCRTLLGLP
jgi:hypothetical protein